MTAKYNCFSSTPSVFTPHACQMLEESEGWKERPGAQIKETRGALRLKQCFPLGVFMLYDHSQAADKRAYSVAHAPPPPSFPPTRELLYVKYQADY